MRLKKEQGRENARLEVLGHRFRRPRLELLEKPRKVKLDLLAVLQTATRRRLTLWPG